MVIDKMFALAHFEVYGCNLVTFRNWSPIHDGCVGR